MKYTRIISSLAIIIGLGSVVAAGTGAFFTDGETSTGNVFTAGNIDLKVDHTFASYLGEECVYGCDGDVPSSVGVTVDENSNANAEVLTFIHPAWTADLDGTGGAGDWVWISNPVSDPTVTQTFTFTKTFVWSGSVSSAQLYVASDNQHRARVNGVLVGASTDENNFQLGTEDVYNIASAMVPGLNTIEVEVDNLGVPGSTPTTNPAGVMFKAVVDGVCDPDEFAYSVGGSCKLWSATDLDDEKFFAFTDVKPGDYGTNTISLHVDSNDAFSCLYVTDVENKENGLTDPENEALDSLTDDDGELGELIDMYFWLDSDKDGIKDATEIELLHDSFAGSMEVPIHDSNMANGVHVGGTTEYVSVAWCAGTLGVVDGSPFTCDGSTAASPAALPSTNLAQTDTISAVLTVYATQSRNNEDFDCTTDGGSDTPDVI